MAKKCNEEKKLKAMVDVQCDGQVQPDRSSEPHRRRRFLKRRPRQAVGRRVGRKGHSVCRSSYFSTSFLLVCGFLSYFSFYLSLGQEENKREKKQEAERE